jgi:predicted AAA+ superfamily ATPase
MYYFMIKTEMWMYRKVMAELVEWRGKKGRMPLILYGARQVGKTYILLEFAKQYYENAAYFNFESNLSLSSYFDGTINEKKIIEYLEMEIGRQIIPGKTLIIFDEIQVCERALTSLKYFNENAPQYHIACAGSLLGVAINREKYSFPVGNVDSLMMHPLDFEEYLYAFDEKKLCEEIKNCYDKTIAMPAPLHTKASELYKKYLITGGMPRVINEYMQGESFIAANDAQRKILSDYVADSAKYASSAESIKIRAAYDSIPVQLAKENKKFQYKLVQKGGTSSIFGIAIEWLECAGIVNKCTKIETALFPLSVYRDLSSFKLYMGDTGLLTLKSGIPPNSILNNEAINIPFVGAIAENYVAQCLTVKKYPLYYWTSGATAEIDFVIQKEGEVVPVEIKAGENIRSRSLSVFTEKYKNKYSIRVSMKNFGFENNILSVPLYAVWCL